MMISRVPSLIITQSRKYAINHFRGHPKKLKGAVIKQPKRNNDDFDYSKQKSTIKTSEEYQEDPEGFGDLESDFMDVHKSHKQFEIEATQYQEQVKRWIIRNKYFKENQPNFLTYAEKQQIKLLHAKDPEEWSVERLSESFPADSITISKIIKTKWSANSTERIRKHDEHVMKNWSLFKKGKLSVQDSLKEHLQKFTERSFDDLKYNQITASIPPALPTPTRTEFSSIITSCKGYKDKQNLIESGENEVVNTSYAQNISPAEKENETFLIEKVKDKRKMRFQDFQRQSKTTLIDAPQISPPENTNESPNSISSSSTIEEEQIEGGKITSEYFKGNNNNPFKKQFGASFSENNETLPDETYFHGKDQLPENPSGTGIIPRKMDDKLTEFVISQEDMKKYEVSTIKEKIYIPRKLWRHGATYKVEDCYYDFDGEFLYRVPGMTGRSK